MITGEAALDGVFASNLAIHGSNQVLKIGWDRGSIRGQEGFCKEFFPTADEHKNIHINGVYGTTDDVFCKIESDVKNLTIRGVRGTCGKTAFSNICGMPYCFSMENVLLDDWMLEGPAVAIDIGGKVRCKGLTVSNSRFTAGDGKGEVGIRISGMGEELELGDLVVEGTSFSGFQQETRIASDVRMLDNNK